jgi:hypothetical protein
VTTFNRTNRTTANKKTTQTKPTQTKPTQTKPTQTKPTQKQNQHKNKTPTQKKHQHKQHQPLPNVFNRQYLVVRCFLPPNTADGFHPIGKMAKQQNVRVFTGKILGHVVGRKPSFGLCLCFLVVPTEIRFRHELVTVHPFTLVQPELHEFSRVVETRGTAVEEPLKHVGEVP